ncbi:GH92 family glycosyl hydrolase [Chitinophaga sp. Ak27]|uniref:GH92 family glycosyl hydrolase n=1 Tax=Chitinophaga sp. Ak27 TaxID=2726116 RepID=UPI00145CA1DE|nr:GH92 family glycosyl hydrolase [Chitinophaga sp. Ak27]NLU90743.1 glycoside hydrolase family 92 protein [Chitinophaga sp. Ak27]
MIYKLKFHFAALCCSIPLLGAAQEKQPAEYVNPFIGATTSTKIAASAHGGGKTFPGATTPFGLTQLSPNTITGGDNGSGYSYEHKSIEGFAFTQMSGIGWYGDLGNFLVMPTTGPLKTNSGKEENGIKGYRSYYDKSTEQAKAGYYSVKLTDYNIRAEMTASPHGGIMRFTFPANKQSRIQIDLARRVGGTSTEQYVKVVNDHAITGWMKCDPSGGGWGNGDGKPNYTVYFYAEFSKPLKNYGIWEVAIAPNANRKREAIESTDFQSLTAHANILTGCNEKQGKHLGFYTTFNTSEGEPVLLKAGISFVSMEGARKNLQQEITDWDFNAIADRSTQMWNDALGKIKISGGTAEQKVIFYTALYHSMIDPRSFTDVDGNYPGGDGNIHHTSKFTKRTIFSGWDVFRSQMPLQTIINPRVVNDMINSLVELAEENKTKYLERWEFLNAYSGCMIGNPAVVVLADAYMKGIRDYDVAKAYEFAGNTMQRLGNGQLGYTPGDISSTLENAYDNWCLAQLAQDLGKQEDYKKLISQSKDYNNVFDTSVGWFRPKDAKGNWSAWPTAGRLEQSYGCVESNPYQQGWFVPHDIEGLTALLGGNDKALADLENFFEKTPDSMLWNNYYNHANEPVHHVPFMFNAMGRPWLTQKWARTICEKAYHNSAEKGLVGNEDVGQMSAWYVLAAIGIHPLCPGDNRYQICTPLFDTITIQLDSKYASGKKFIIKTINNAPENKYIKSAKLNGKTYEKSWLDHNVLRNGGTLELTLSPEPNRNWGSK